MFTLSATIHIVEAFGGYVVYRSALSGKSPVYRRFDTPEQASAYRAAIQNCDPTAEWL